MDTPLGADIRFLVAIHLQNKQNMIKAERCASVEHWQSLEVLPEWSQTYQINEERRFISFHNNIIVIVGVEGECRPVLVPSVSAQN